MGKTMRRRCTARFRKSCAWMLIILLLLIR
ncbi:UNVERIFIED_CONTAM: hypothetical protein GTU68_014423 [Idotea baltica]|nr:hypothetical protein [Idotea baltica]